MRKILFISALTVAGCETGMMCTEMGCGGSLTINASAEDWADGTYDLEVQLGDNDPQVCSFVMPFDDASVDCDFELALSSEGSELSVELSTRMGEDASDVTLSLSGTEVATDTIAISWGAPLYPNGETCDAGNGCVSSQVAWDLAFD